MFRGTFIHWILSKHSKYFKPVFDQSKYWNTMTNLERTAVGWMVWLKNTHRSYIINIIHSDAVTYWLDEHILITSKMNQHQQRCDSASYNFKNTNFQLVLEHLLSFTIVHKRQVALTDFIIIIPNLALQYHLTACTLYSEYFIQNSAFYV